MPYSPNLYDMGGTRFVASEFCNCLMAQDAEAEGRLAVQSIITALENGTSPDDVIIENDLITKDNVSDFLENMEGAVN